MNRSPRTVTKDFDGWREDSPAEKILFRRGFVIWVETDGTGDLVRFTFESREGYSVAQRLIVIGQSESAKASE